MLAAAWQAGARFLAIPPPLSESAELGTPERISLNFGIVPGMFASSNTPRTVKPRAHGQPRGLGHTGELASRWWSCGVPRVERSVDCVAGVMWVLKERTTKYFVGFLARDAGRWSGLLECRCSVASQRLVLKHTNGCRRWLAAASVLHFIVCDAGQLRHHPTLVESKTRQYQRAHLPLRWWRRVVLRRGLMAYPWTRCDLR